MGLHPAPPKSDNCCCIGRASLRPALEGITIDSAEFQGLWARLGPGVESAFDLAKVPRTAEEVEGLLSARGVHTMASGNKPAAMKFFFYAKARTRNVAYLFYILLLRLFCVFHSLSFVAIVEFCFSAVTLHFSACVSSHATALVIIV